MKPRQPTGGDAGKVPNPGRWYLRDKGRPHDPSLGRKGRSVFSGPLPPLLVRRPPLDTAGCGNAALFFASQEAEFLTGIVLEIDGGRTI